MAYKPHGNTLAEITQREHTEISNVPGKRVFNIDSDGNVLNFREIEIKGEISTDNSTTTPLLAGGVFTGSSFEILNSGVVFVNVYSDVASATDGLSIQQSSDATNWDHSDHFTIPAATGKNFAINPHARYIRVVYTNGGSAQSVFRLQTICKGDSVPSSHRIQDAIADDDDARLVKSVLTGKANGSFVNVNTTVDGDLKISDNSNGLSIAQNNVTGTSFVHKFGDAPDFDTGDGEVTIWDGANDGVLDQMTYSYSSAPSINSVSSDNAGDTQDIEIQGLDENYDLLTQTVTLSGQSLVSIPTAYLRVFRMKNVGTTDLAGNAYCYENTAITAGVPDDSSLVRAVINDGNNQTLMAIYTIPNGKTGYLRSFFCSEAGASRNTNYIVRLQARPLDKVFQLKHKTALSSTGSSHIQHDYVEPEVFSEKTDIQMTAEITESAITGGDIAAGFDIVLVDN
jgi:hypothetical protein